MPKRKTNKGARKRVRITKRGKVKRFRTKTSHLLVVKSAKVRRRLRKPMIAKGALGKTLAHLAGGRA